MGAKNSLPMNGDERNRHPAQNIAWGSYKNKHGRNDSSTPQTGLDNLHLLSSQELRHQMDFQPLDHAAARAGWLRSGGHRRRHRRAASGHAPENYASQYHSTSPNHPEPAISLFSSFSNDLQNHIEEGNAAQVPNATGAGNADARPRRRKSSRARPPKPPSSKGSASASETKTIGSLERGSNVDRKTTRKKVRRQRKRSAREKAATPSGFRVESIAQQALATIECPICLGYYDESADRVPCTLRCGHSFCLSHMPQLSACPICRRPIPYQRFGQEVRKNVVLCDASSVIVSMLSILGHEC